MHFLQFFTKDKEKKDKNACLSQAHQLYLAKDYEKAERLYKDAIKIDSSSIQAYNHLGILYNAQNKYRQAKKQFKQAIKIDPKSVHGHYNLGNVYHNQKKFSQAIECFKEALKINPKLAQAYNSLGIVYKDQDRLKEAEDSFKEAIKLNPKLFSAYSNLGQLYEDSGLEEEAEDCYKKALKNNNKLSFIYYRLAILYKGQQKFRQAQENLKICLKESPNYSHAHYTLGLVCSNLNRLAEAEKSYKQAIKNDEKFVSAYNSLGVLYKNQKKYELAQSQFKEALRIDSKYVKAYYNLGILFSIQLKFKEAEQSYKTAIKIDPQYSIAYNNLCLIYIAVEKYQQAYQQICQAIKYCPDHPLYQMNKSNLLYKLKKPGEAYQEMKQFEERYNFGNEQIVKILKKKFELSKQNVEWIKLKLEQFRELERLNEQKFFKGKEFSVRLSGVFDTFFENLNSETPQQSQKVIEENRKFKAKITDVKNLSLIDQKSDSQIRSDYKKLLKQRPGLKIYFNKLVTTLHTSVSSYRAIETGILQPGEEVIKSNVAKCIKFLEMPLAVAEKVPFVSNVASVVAAVGKMYLGKELDHVTKIIVYSFSQILPGQDLTNAFIEMVLFLSKEKKFEELINKQIKENSDPWYASIKRNIRVCLNQDADKSIREKMMTKVTHFSGHELLKQQNIAMQHCVQILVTIIKEKNWEELQKSENKLRTAAKIWLQKESKKIIDQKDLSTKKQEKCNVM